MSKNNIIIAFSSDKICNNLCTILNKNGIIYNHICKTGANLRKYCSYYENGIILCGTNFIDESTYNIVEDFYKDFCFLLIGSLDKINIYDNKKVYKLPTPIKQEDIINALDMAYYKNIENIKTKNLKFINEAKNLLILHNNFTEDTAHKYIQKKSMNTGKKNIDIAKIIISKYKKREL
ncbi:ANTAR domain-containing response regulator [[Clostridium] colinum]|uniref:ANTAR domain-containing response regulator n=1 Tax=[Clostridium] colinum TaxID=36835 RepID=UPI0020244C35|nr:ANTAR domain-containing protein [[Clostridium] colinum]